MRYYSNINNVKSLEWGLNIQQAYLFAWLYELPSWAEKVILENKVYYFASKNKAVSELPILTEKVDTMYRYYKQLEEKQLIEIKKIDNKDYVCITAKGQLWNSSEQSEKNPTILGKKSELSSEKNPTYNINNSNNINNNKSILSDFEIFEQFWNTYDRKEGMFQAQKEWMKLSEQDKKLALAHAPKYSAANEQKYRPKPAKYLADREFENEVIICTLKKEQSTFLSKEQTEKQKAFENNWNWALKNFKYDPDAPYKTFGSKSDCMKFFEANGGTYSLEKHNYYMQNSVRP